jgi:hypothetical protein
MGASSAKAMEPEYQELHRSSRFTLRKYKPMLVAQVDKTGIGMGTGEDDQEACRALEKYLRGTGDGDGEQGQGMKRRGPVLRRAALSQSLSLSQSQSQSPTPLLEHKGDALSSTGSAAVVAIVLSDKYQTVDEVPRSLDPRVSVTAVPERVVAVKKFSGFGGVEESAAVARRFYRDLVVDHVSQFIAPRESIGVCSSSGGRGDTLDSIQWQVAHFSSSSTLPFMRRNEIWIEIVKDEEQALLKQLHTPK